MQRDLAADALARYERTVSLAELIRAEWSRLGEPLTAEGSKGQDVPHPLLKLLAETEINAQRFARSCKNVHRGSTPLTLVSASPAAELRAEREPPRVTLKGAGPSDVA